MSWQEKLDGLFPSGVKIVQIDDVPEGVDQDGDESVSFHVPKLTVLEENEDGSAVVRGFIYEFPKDVTFTIKSLNEVSPGTYLAETTSKQKDYLLSSNLPKGLEKALKEAQG
jgi:hypothetical protein